jgi:murein DD-endopeptidase MepM/ murein hydrolase activator NlpD
MFKYYLTNIKFLKNLALLVLSIIISLSNCIFQERKKPPRKVGIKKNREEALTPEMISQKAKSVNEEIFSKQDYSEARSTTVKDLLTQLQLKKDEYCNNKINDLDDFPVEPSQMCCDLNFMNIDPRKGKIHYGFDIPLGIGTPLKCPDKEDCLVVRVYPEWITRDGVPVQTIYGESLLVYFKKAGYFGFYAHLKKVFGRQGRIFNYKDVMALSGNSGSLSTGAHLHFTIFRNQDCSNGVFDEKMRLAVLDTIEEIKIFEAKEKGIDPAFYNIEEKSSEEILKRCKVNLSQEANRACIVRNFPRDFIDPIEVTSDQTIQRLVLEINPKRMRDRDVLKLFSYHQRVRNNTGIHSELRKSINTMPTNVSDLKELLRDVNILGEEL